MLPYQYAGGIAYNAFHNAGVRCQLNSTKFLPAAWRNVASERDGKKPYQNLWIASRGPASHGCTRLASGHMTRAAPDRAVRVDGPRAGADLPQSARLLRRLRRARRRHAGRDRRPVLRRLQVRHGAHADPHLRDEPSRSVLSLALRRQRRARAGGQGDACARCRSAASSAARPRRQQALSNVPLYEAPFEPETIQFYTVKRVPFDSDKGMELNRELRKVGAGHTLDRGKLLLD